MSTNAMAFARWFETWRAGDTHGVRVSSVVDGASAKALTKAAEVCGCYKVILDCSEENAGFYERCGYSRKEIQMAKYFV